MNPSHSIVTIVRLLIGVVGLALFAADARAESGTIAFNLGGPGVDYGKDVAVDEAGNIYLALYFQGTVDFDLGPGVAERTALGDPRNPGATDVALASYTPAGALRWLVTFGSPAADIPHTVQVDSAGNSVVIGYIGGDADVDPSPDERILRGGVGRNVVIAAYDPAGALRWAHTLGDAERDPLDESGRDDGFDLALDAAGNVWATGVFGGVIDLDPSDGPDAADTFASDGDAPDGWFGVWDAQGAFRRGGRVGGPGRDQGHGIRPLADGSLVLTGFFSATATFAPNDGASATSTGAWDIFLARYDAGGALEWLRRVGSPSSNDQVRPGGIEVTDAGDISITGNFGGTADFDPGDEVAALTARGPGDIFLARYDAAGRYRWAIGMGGPGLDWSHRVALDAEGNAVITGEFVGEADFDPSAAVNSVQAAGSDGATDLFVAAYDAAGGFRWAHGIGATVSGRDAISHGTGVATAPDGTVVVTGRFHGEADFSGGEGSAVLRSAGSADCFLVRYRPDGRWA